VRAVAWDATAPPAETTAAETPAAEPPAAVAGEASGDADADGDDAVGDAVAGPEDVAGEDGDDAVGEEAAGAELAALVPDVLPSSVRSCGECGSTVVAARAAARAWIDGLAPGTAPSAGSAPAGSGPRSPWPAERGSAWAAALAGLLTAGAAAGSCCPAGAVLPALPDPEPSAFPAPRGTVAVAAGPAAEGSAAGATSVGDGEVTARITATDPPPAAVSASAEAASARFDLMSTGARLGRGD